MEISLDDLESAKAAIQHQGIMNMSIAQAYVYLPSQSPVLPATTLEYVIKNISDFLTNAAFL
jgi:hypothetical protein